MSRNAPTDPHADEEMLSQDPPPLAIRLIGWLILAVFASALAVAVFVPLPETVKCAFVLVSEDGADPVQTPLLGVLQKVEIEEGQTVAAGQVMFQLRSDEIRSWRTALRTYEEDLRALSERAPAAEQSHEESVAIKKKELEQAGRELEFSGKRFEAKRDVTDRMRKLAADGLISTVELNTFELDLEQAWKELEVGRQLREQIALELGRLETERARARTEEAAQRKNLETRIAALRKQLEDCQDDVMQIRAPYDGVIISLAQRNAGNVVDEGQVLCQLARAGGRPRVRLFLNEEGLPRLSEGKPVKLYFEAFPYQRHGVVEGSLQWISPAAVETQDGPRFVGYAGLNAFEIAVEGENKPLRIGMKGRARIRVGERTLMEFAFEPLRQIRENLRP